MNIRASPRRGISKIWEEVTTLKSKPHFFVAKLKVMELASNPCDLPSILIRDAEKKYVDLDCGYWDVGDQCNVLKTGAVVYEEDGDVCTGMPECIQQVASKLLDSIGEGSKDLIDDVFSKNDQYFSSTRPLITFPGNDRDNEMDPNLTFNGAYKKVIKRKITFKKKNSGVSLVLLLSGPVSNGADHHGESHNLMMVKRMLGDMDVDMIDCDDSLLNDYVLIMLLALVRMIK